MTGTWRARRGVGREVLGGGTADGTGLALPAEENEGEPHCGRPSHGPPRCPCPDPWNL